METECFRLFKGKSVVRFQAISELHWRVIGVEGETGSKVGDEVSPVRKVSWREAKRRVNSRRSAVSPNQLVLLRGEGQERSDQEVSRLLDLRPWEPGRTAPCPVPLVGTRGD